MSKQLSQQTIESRDDALEKLDETIEKLESASPSEKMELCREYVEALARAFAADSIDNSTKDECISSLSQNSPFNKSHLEERFEEEYDSHSDESDEDSIVLCLDEWIREHTDSLEVVQSEDSNIDTSYIWTFDDGTVVETEGEQFDWEEFARVLTDANYEFAFTEPCDGYRDKSAWKFEFLLPYIRSNAEKKTVSGTRSDVIRDLKNAIQSTRAFEDIKEAYQTTGIYIEDSDPEWVYVASSVVSTIADEHSVTTRALQVEIDSRGVTSGGVSVIKSVGDGRQSRFWELPVSFAEPCLPDKNESGKTAMRGDDDEA
jgi:hypothetical protein